MANPIHASHLARFMASASDKPTIQADQILFRLELVEAWQIPQGAKILEIGCGQGDMTVVLADAVGEEGHITAVDIADPDYGAPITIGKSAEHLKSTMLGKRIDFHFQTDVLNPEVNFADNSFDYVVMAHCSWYFESVDKLKELFHRIRPWTNRLCFSEWDMAPQSHNQLGHMLAVLIQGQVEAHKRSSESNIRSPISKSRLKNLLQETDWYIAREPEVDSTRLQDADWEIENCLRHAVLEAEELGLPARVLEFVRNQADVLRSVAHEKRKLSMEPYLIDEPPSVAPGKQNRSLGSYAIVAERSD